MRVLVYDTESDGLLDEATTIHCAVTKDSTGVVTRYKPDDIGKFIRTLGTLSTDTIIVCHNQIGHDLPLMEKLYDYRHRGRVLDTLTMSRLLNPERMGRHGLEAWGGRLGRPKPRHDDWSTYSREMLYRCEQDVEINWLVFLELMKEAEMDEEELVCLPSY